MLGVTGRHVIQGPGTGIKMPSATAGRRCGRGPRCPKKYRNPEGEGWLPRVVLYLLGLADHLGNVVHKCMQRQTWLLFCLPRTFNQREHLLAQGLEVTDLCRNDAPCPEKSAS